MKKLFFFLAISLGLLATSMQAQTVATEDRMIALTQNGETTLLAPNGADESYFWTSISPDGTKILYVTARHGAFVCNLDGTEVRSLGYMNAPVWANDQWVVGMQDIDDGEDVISSKLLAVTIDGEQRQDIRTNEKIAMYPKTKWEVGSEKWEVTYQNLEGETFTAKVSLPAVKLTAKNIVADAKCVRRAPQQKANTTGALAGLKIYVNPGHGGYDGDDRSIWTIPVPETWSNPDGYWESKSNLSKGLALQKLLEDAGAEVIMSRITNTSADDRALSGIAEEANANDVDHFLSIHSNALNSTTNYLLLLYHGKTGEPKVVESDKMAASSAALQIQNKLAAWNASTARIYGDWTFYDDTEASASPGLGVLRPLTVPGFLSEGSFHDYAPETHRLMSDDYCKIEALRFFQHFHKYYNRTLPQTGTIAGWVKSGNELVDILNQPKFYYFAGSDDQWLPLNGVVVELQDASGNVLQSYTTDNWYNGIFAFYDLTPGTYQIVTKKDKYASKPMTVTVAAEEITNTKVFMTNTRVEVEDYPQPEQEAGAIAPNRFDFEAQGDKAALAATGIVRALYRDNQIVVLTADNAVTIYSTAGVKKATVAVPAGVTLSDIAFSADGYLMGLSVAGEDVTIYTWDELTGDAYSFLTQKVAGVGTSFAVSRARWEAKIYLTATKQLVGLQYDDDTQTVSAVKTLALDKDLTGAQLAIMPSGELYVDSKTLPTMSCAFDWNAADGTALVAKELATADSEYQPQDVTTGSSFFRYAGGVYMTELLSDEAGANVGFRIVNITDGMAVGKHVSTKYPEAGMGATAAPYMAAFALVEGYDVTVYLLVEGQGIQTFKTIAAPVANIYAAEVRFAAETGFTFRLNENATNVRIAIEKRGKVVDTYDTGALAKGVHTIANPFEQGFDAFEITASARSVVAPTKISTDEEHFQFYAPRGVAVDKTPTSPYFGRVYVTNSGAGSDGYSAFTSKQTMGVFVLSSDLTDVTAQEHLAYQGGLDWANGEGSYQFAFARPTVAPDGRVFVPSAAPATTGIYIMDPANPSAAFEPLFKGRRDAATGCVRKASAIIHNMVMNAVVQGEGKDMKLYTYDRNITGTTFSNIHQYNIGELDSLPWTEKPSAVLYDDAANNNTLENGNGQLASDNRGGWWMSQYRAGSGGTAKPALIHVTGGVVDYNCGSSIASSYQGGMAVSADGNRLAIGTITGNVDVYDLEYDAANKPTLTLAYSVDWGAGKGNTMGLDFDVAGNIYIVSNSNERLMVYSLPKLDNSYTTRIAYNHYVAEPELNIYASGLKAGEIKDGKVEISYVLNATATALSLQLIDKDNTLAKEIAIEDAALLEVGAHTTTINLADVASGAYTWALKASAAATNELTDVTPTTEGLYNYYLPQGLAVNLYPESEYFGYVYVSEGTNGDTDGMTEYTKTMTEGIYIYNPLLEDYTSQGMVGYAGGVQWSADRQGPKRIQVAEDGTLFICDNGADGTSGVWMMDPANPSADFKAALDVAGRGTNFVKVAAIDVVGTGADRVLYTLDNISTSTGTANAYAIGECATPFAGAPTSIFDPLSVTIGNQDCAIAADGKGGFWICQNRWGDDAYKALIHVNAAGQQDFASNATLLPFTANISYRGVVALNADKTLLVMGSDKSAVVFAIAYDAETGVPTLTELYRTPQLGGNIDGVAFDYANNLYVCSASVERFYAFATPKADNSSVTPAAAKYILHIEATGLENVNMESVKVRKAIENGQVVIIKDGVKYNILGTIIR